MKGYILTKIFLLIISLHALSQGNIQSGILPSLNINAKLPKDWSVNFKTESRQSLFQDKFNYDYILTDISLIAAKKVSINTSISIGYLISIRDKNIINRSIQQISFISRHPAFTLSHRIAADQSYNKNEPTEYRFRYRLASQLPLSGQSLDPKEFFIKLSQEYLNSTQKNEYDLEIRSSAFMGYQITAKNKLELGVDYRIDSFTDNKARHRFWIGINLYQSI